MECPSWTEKQLLNICPKKVKSSMLRRMKGQNQNLAQLQQAVQQMGQQMQQFMQQK